jgi:hypothetical protein
MVLVKETFILTDVLYGCETWSLTLREENREEVTAGSGKLHNKELQMKENEISGVCNTGGREQKHIQSFVLKT